MSEEEENSNEENENDEEKEDNEEETEEDNENEENDDESKEKEEEEEEGEEEEENKKDKNEKNKKVKFFLNNKFLQSKLHKTNEIKLDINSNSSDIFGNNINNNSFLTATFPVQSSLQLLTDINNEMDILSSKINKVVPKFSISSYNNITGYSSYSTSNTYRNYNKNYDKEDFEIKKLINKVYQITNTDFNNIHNNNFLKRYENNHSQFNKEYFNSFNTYHDRNYKFKNSIMPNFYKNYNFNSLRNLTEYKNNNRRIQGKPFHNNFANQNNLCYYKNGNDNGRKRYNSHHISNRYFTNNNYNGRINNKYNNFRLNTFQNRISKKKNYKHFLNKNKKYKLGRNSYQNTFNQKNRIHINREPEYINKLNNNNYISERFKYRHFSIGNVFNNNNINKRENIFKNKNKYLKLDLNKL